MPGSVTSVFGEPEDCQAALREEGVLGMLITGRGRFRARLTQITLHRLRLSAAEEHLPRIVFVAVPADSVLVLLPIGGVPSSIWGGIAMQVHEIIALGPGQRVHARTDGPCRWGTIRLPAQDLAGYGRALRGAGFVAPQFVARWQSPPAARRELRHLHQVAIRAAEAGSTAFTDGEAVHGLEQQLIEALVECLSAGPIEVKVSAHWHREILARFEGLLQMQPVLRVAEICAALGVTQVLRGAPRDESEQLSPPPPDATGAARATQRKFGRGHCRRGRAPVRSPPPRPFRRGLLRSLWRIAVRHVASGSPGGVTELTLGRSRVKVP
jgi:hypothetical protein